MKSVSPSQTITEEKYVVTQNICEANIIIKNTKEPPLTLTIHLTSPLVREEMEKTVVGGKPPHTETLTLSSSGSPLSTKGPCRLQG